MKNARLCFLVLAAAGVAGCSRDAEPARKTARTWSCSPVSIPGGESLSCTSAALTADGPTQADSETCEGALDNPDECPPGATASSGAAEAGAIWADYTVSYRCTAGGIDCPPAGATPGTNTGATTDGASSGRGDGTGTADKGSTTDGTSSSTGDGEKADKDDPKEGGDANGGAGEQYDCRGKGERRECVKTPSGGTTDGATGGAASGGGSGSGGVNAGGEPGLSGGSSTGTTTSNGKEATFDGSKNKGDGTSTWCWSVVEVSGQDLSNWVIGTGKCQVVNRSPSNASENVVSDPNSGLMGVKWGTGGGFSAGQFCVTVQGTPTAGPIKFSMKAPGVAYGMTRGPVCQ